MNRPTDPLIDAAQRFPLGPSVPYRPPTAFPVLVPFGIRYAVPPVVEAADQMGNNATHRRVSINVPTSGDGKKGERTIIDDVVTDGDD